MNKKVYEKPSVVGIELTIETDVIADSGSVSSPQIGSGGDLNVRSTREFSLLDREQPESKNMFE